MSAALETLDVLSRRGSSAVEVFTKTGRSRVARLELGHGTSRVAEEHGWAVRAGDERASFHACGTGEVEPAGPWPDGDGGGLRLPPAGPEPWQQPPDVDEPLLGETESLGILGRATELLSDELPEAVALRGTLEDGSAEIAIHSSQGIAGSYRTRVAAARLWARLGEHEAEVVVTDRQARRLSPAVLAQRVADRLVVAQRGVPATRDRGEVVLSPEVGCVLLAGLEPLLVGWASWQRLLRLADRRGRLASPQLTIVDDGRLAGGLLEAPFDGEGVATRRVVLIEAGEPRQPLLAWWEGERGTTSGCSLRAGWRDLPLKGATHLYVESDPKRPPGSLIAAMSRGHYFIETTSDPLFDLEEGCFRVGVRGFTVRAGRASRPISRASLSGSIHRLLAGVQAVGRDLRFLPQRRIFGAPSLLVSGLEVNAP